MSDGTDILGTPLTESEKKLLAAYETLKSLRGEDLSPTVNAAVAESIASLWQACNNLGLTDERPDV
jgi:hypothetical protein